MINKLFRNNYKDIKISFSTFQIYSIFFLGKNSKGKYILKRKIIIYISVQYHDSELWKI